VGTVFLKNASADMSRETVALQFINAGGAERVNVVPWQCRRMRLALKFVQIRTNCWSCAQTLTALYFIGA